MKCLRNLTAALDALLEAVGVAAAVWSYSATAGPAPAPRPSTRPLRRRHGHPHSWVNADVLRRATRLSTVVTGRTDPGRARPRCRIRLAESRRPHGREERPA